MQAYLPARKTAFSAVDTPLEHASPEAGQQNILSQSWEVMFGLIVGQVFEKGGVYVSVQTAQRTQRPSCSSSCRDP
jgi:hypothetical protein